MQEQFTSSASSESCGDSSNSWDESTTLCSICNRREPDPIALRCVGKSTESLDWVCCDKCEDWVYCYCAYVDHEIVIATSFACYKCTILLTTK